jgi:putative ABC transport system permease protein
LAQPARQSRIESTARRARADGDEYNLTMRRTRPLTVTGIVWRNLYRQPLRTALTVLGVALGVIAIVALGALVQGIHDAIDAGLHLGGAELTVFEAGVAADILSSLNESETRAKLLSDPDVNAVAAGMSHIMPVGDQRFTVVIGVEPNGFTYSTEYVDGPPITNADEISLGSLAARTFKKARGDTLQIGERTYRIVSTFNTGVVVYDASITMRLDVLQEMLGRQNQATAFFLDLRDGADPASVGRRLEAANPELVAIGGAAEYHKVDMGLQIAQGAVWAVTLAAVVIGSVIVLNTMWMTVLERTREIGVLRAVGWSRREVLVAVLAESLVVGLAALAIGAALGVLMARLIVHAPVVQQFVRPTFAVQQFVIAGAAAVLLSVLGGALPAWRAARISPAEALRYE